MVALPVAVTEEASQNSLKAINVELAARCAECGRCIDIWTVAGRQFAKIDIDETSTGLHVKEALASSGGPLVVCQNLVLPAGEMLQDTSLVLEYLPADSGLTLVIVPHPKRVKTLRAVKVDGLALQHAPEALQHDREVVTAAVQEDGWALQFAADPLKRDRQVVLQALRKSGGALRFVHEDLKHDRCIILAAVKQSGLALQQVPVEFLSDRDIVLEAVKQNGDALQYATDELKSNRQVAIAAIKRSGDTALRFVSPELQADPGLWDEAKNWERSWKPDRH